MEQRSYAQRDQQEELRRRMLGERRRNEKRKTDQKLESGFSAVRNFQDQPFANKNIDSYDKEGNFSDQKNQEQPYYSQKAANFPRTNARGRLLEPRKREQENTRGLESQRRGLLNDRRRYLSNMNGKEKKIVVNSKANVAKRKISAFSEIAADSKVLVAAFINPLNMFKLFGKVDLLKDAPLIMALIVSGGDDFIIDWSGLTDVLPGTGSVISFCVDIFNGFMNLLVLQAEGGNMDRMKQRMLRRSSLLVGSICIELFPILDILPTEVFAVGSIYIFILAERERNEERQKNISYGGATKDDLAEEDHGEAGNTAVMNEVV